MTFKVLFRVLLWRWISFVITFVLVLGAVGAYTYFTPKVYTAEASIVIDPKFDPISGSVLAGMASPSYLMTQVDILQSKRVASRVVSALKLTEITELRQQWVAKTKGTGDYAGWLADLMRSSMDVRPSRGSNLINLYFSGNNPEFASTLANAFVKAYLDTTLELRTAPARDYSRFFDTNAKSLRDALEAAQAKLSAFQQRTGLVVSDERLDVETQRLNELNAQLTNIQAVAADSRSRETQAQAQGDRSLDVMASPMVASLRAEIARQESQLEQIGSRLGENHPTVRELRAGLADNRTRMDAEIKRAQSTVGVTNQVQQSRVAQARVALEEQRAKVLKLRAVRDEASVLQRDVENAQRAYDGVLARLNLSSLESQNNQPSVVALERATSPNQPSSPRVFLNLLLGGVVALIAGLIVVAFRESQDRRLRDGADLEALLGQPLLGVVPSFRKKSRLLSLRRKASATPLIGAAPRKSLTA